VKTAENSKSAAHISVTQSCATEKEEFASDRIEELKLDKKKMTSMRLSQAEIRFCYHMAKKYDKDFEAMARDPMNYFQLTPAQLRKKFNLFDVISAP